MRFERLIQRLLVRSLEFAIGLTANAANFVADIE